MIHLGLGDLQQLGQLLLVRSRLGKQQQELAVGKHHSGCVGIETFLHILGDACHHRGVFTESLPCLIQKLAAVIGHIPFSQGIEEQVDLIDVHMSVLSFLPVGNDPVKDGIQHDQQAHRLETFAQLLDIIANDPVLRVHIGLMGKDIQAAFCKQFQSQRQPMCFRLRLLEQIVIQIQQCGRIPFVCFQIILIDVLQAPVNDALVPWFNRPMLQLLAKRHDKFTFEHQRIAAFAIFCGNIQCIDMIGSVCRNGYDLTAQGVDQGAILPFRIDHDDIVVSAQGNGGDLLLGCKALAGAGNAQDEAVSIEQLFPIAEDQIMRHGIDTVVDSAFVPDLLAAERSHHRHRFCGQGAHHIDPPQAVGQTGVQPILLLPFQNADLAVAMRSGHRTDGFGILIQFFFCVSQMSDRKQPMDHVLIPNGDIIHYFLGHRPGLLQLIGNIGRKLVVHVLPGLPARNIGLHRHDLLLHFLYGFVCGFWNEIQRQHHVFRQISQLRNQIVFDKVGIFSQKEHPAHLVSQLKPIFLKLDALRGNSVFEVMSFADVVLQVKGKFLLLGPEEIVEQPQPFFQSQFLQVGIQLAQAAGQIHLQPLKKSPGFLHRLFFHRNSDEHFPDHIIAFSGFLFHHIIVFCSVMIQPIPFQSHQLSCFKFFPIHLVIDQTDLAGNIGGQHIDHCTPGQNHLLLPLHGGHRIIDVGKTPCF